MAAPLNAPLEGLRVLVTRPLVRAAPLVAALESRGAHVTTVPVIEIEALGLPANWNALLERATDVVVTSGNAVIALQGALGGLDARVWAVGPETAAALAAAFVAAQPLTQNFTVAELAEHLVASGVAGRRFLLAQAERPHADLAGALRDAGAEVEALAVYRNVRRPAAVGELRDAFAAGVDAITFLSGSAVGATLSALGGPEAVGEAVVVCIGPSTAAVAEHLGLRSPVVADVHTGVGVVDALAAHIARVSA